MLLLTKWQTFDWLAVLVISMHFFGFWLMLWQPTSAFFVSLTPLNLMVSLFVMLYFHHPYSRQFLLSCLLMWVGGFLIELAGVQTGLVFGRYAYGSPLGVQLWQTPLIIGVNWLLLIYALASVVAHRQWTLWQKALFIGASMTLLDVLIEPFAIHFGLWHWYGSYPPLQNYLAWFVAGTLLGVIFLWLNQNALRGNRMATVVLLSQIVFFIAHDLIIFSKM